MLSQPVNNSIPLHQYLYEWYHYYAPEYLPNGIDGKWKYETIACYVYNTPKEFTVPLYQYSNGVWNHFYTLEYKPYGIDNWLQYERINCYVYPIDF